MNVVLNQIGWLCIAVNAGLIAYNVYKARQLHRSIDRILTLDRLLANYCANAFHYQTSPVWRAWIGTMGEIGPDGILRRKDWTED